MTGVLGALYTRQLLFDGVISGMVFGLVAMGIVLVYRSTRVINFAVANLGIIGAGLFALLVAQYSVPFWIAVVIGLVVGTLYGAIVELIVIRRLFTAPRVIVLVATIGIAQLSLAILLAYPEIDAPGARFPVAIGAVREIAGVRVVGPQLAILIVVPLVAIGLGWFMNRTAIGKSVKASADNPDLARLAGISPKLVSTLVWAVAGGLATLSISLLAGAAGSAQNLDNLGPSTLVRALAAAVIAGMASFPRAFFAGIAIGVVQALISFNFLDQPGLMDFLVFLAVFVAVYWQSRSGVGETQTFSFAAKARPIPERLRPIWWLRQIDRIGLVLLGFGAVVLPLIVTEPSRQLLYTSILGFAICALSLTVLTGWAGQLSLGQMAFAGIGALLTASFMRGLNFDVGWGDLRFKAGIEALRFGPSLVFAALITAGIAVLVGAGALRVRGLYLAVVTFAFGLAASQYLYDRPILNGGFSDSVPLARTDVFGIDVTSQRAFYYVVLAVLIVATIIVSRLRTTGIGRGTIAVRDNPDTASSYTVSTTRAKLRAFALAGGLAGLGGALLAANVQAVPSDRIFTVTDSLLLVAIVVIGGLGSVAGTVLGAVWVIGLPAFFPDNDIVPLLTSSVGLLVLLLYFPGGLVQIGYATREAIIGWAEARLGPAPPKAHHAVPRRSAEERPALARGRARPAGQRGHGPLRRHRRRRPGLDRRERRRDRRADRDQRGGQVDAHERRRGVRAVIGLDRVLRRARGAVRLGPGPAGIGPELPGGDALPRAHRAGDGPRGLRGPQAHRSAVQRALLPPAIRHERQHRAEADELIDFLGLGRYADNYIADLSTGTRRIVELAGLLALDARLLCLDEPTAGVAQRETEAFGPLIVEVRRELGASMLVIEHDMPLIMSISDRVYCLELGQIICEGLPSTVRNDPAVIASYLGTDERAIARSGAAAPAAGPGALDVPEDAL